MYASSELGIPEQQHDALGVLVLEFPDGCRMSQLASALRVDASTATHAVDRLEGAGLAERRRAPEDGRVMIVKASAKGVALWAERMFDARKRLEKRLDAALTPEEVETLADLLERVIAMFDEAAPRFDL